MQRSLRTTINQADFLMCSGTVVASERQVFLAYLGQTAMIKECDGCQACVKVTQLLHHVIKPHD